ncbi:molybdenum cofactor guanylyltransferase [Deinococcus sp.]|uniref:molybdenum cofactor guanylyltransferase n=1 Tax=Deinococcus sp. TaxID=47478 RepID=UPI003C797FB5
MKTPTPLHPDPPPLSLAAAITAGGHSRRFGQDKALYPLGGVPLLNRVAASMEGCAPRLLIAPEGRYVLPAWQLVPDLRPGGGPLAGLETALAALTAQVQEGGWLAFSAVDLPFLISGYWALLAGQLLAGSRAGGVQAVTGLDESGRRQPLAALYHTSALPQVTALLDGGERRMKALLNLLPVREVGWRSVHAVCPGAFVNLNTPPGLPWPPPALPDRPPPT